MFYIGCHLSSAKGFLAMAKDAERIGATTFQFFTRNPRGGNAKKPDPEDIAAFLKRKEELGLGPLITHAPYTLNAASINRRSGISRFGLCRRIWNGWSLFQGIIIISIPAAMWDRGARKGSG